MNDEYGMELSSVSLRVIPHSTFYILFLLVDDKGISDGAVLFLRCVGVGGEGGAQGGLLGLFAHGLIDDGGAFGGNFGAGDLSCTIDPNVNHYDAFFCKIIAGSV